VIMIKTTLYASEIESLPSLRKWPDAAICILILIKSVYFFRDITTAGQPVQCWYYEKLRRLFWGNPNNSIHSLHVPFIIDIRTDNSLIVRTTHNIELKYEYFDELLFLFRNIKKHDYSQHSIEGLDNEFSDMLQEHQIHGRKEIENLWNVFCILSTFEPGYIRYDYDIEHENGRIHPRYHLDANYDKNGTYKIGLHDTFSIDDFSDLIDKSTNCYFLHKSL